MRVTDRQLRDGEPTIDDMRHDLAEQEANTLQHSDIMELLLHGFEGLENMDDIDVRDEWNALLEKKGSYGEEKSARAN